MIDVVVKSPVYGRLCSFLHNAVFGHRLKTLCWYIYCETGLNLVFYLVVILERKSVVQQQVNCYSVIRLCVLNRTLGTLHANYTIAVFPFQH